MATIQRVLPAWHAGNDTPDHIFGNVPVTFDQNSQAVVVDQSVLDIMAEFPETFLEIAP